MGITNEQKQKIKAQFMKSENNQKAMVAKFEAYGLSYKAATECVAVAVIYEAIFENIVHETDAAATLAAAVAHSLAVNER